MSSTTPTPNPTPTPKPNPTVTTTPTPEKKETIVDKIEDKAKAFIKSDKMREPQNSQEFLTKNTIRLIEKTYWFMGIILALFILVAMFRESIIETILPLFTLVIGGILGFMSKDLLRSNNDT